MQFAGIAFSDGQCAKQIMPSRLQINRIGWQKNIMLKGQDSTFLTGSRLKKNSTKLLHKAICAVRSYENMKRLRTVV